MSESLAATRDLAQLLRSTDVMRAQPQIFDAPDVIRML
jgi:hypothetical protein